MEQGCYIMLHHRVIGTFSLSVAVDKLFFIGSQMVALSRTGKVGIWHSMTHNWQVQGGFCHLLSDSWRLRASSE